MQSTNTAVARRKSKGRPFELGEADRLSGWRLWAFWSSAAAVRLYLSTLRIEVSEEDLEALRATLLGRTLVKWHSYSLITPRILQKLFCPPKTAALISAGKRGAIQTRFYEWYGIHVERGSTSRRSLHALRKLIKLQSQGYDTLISPDGPSGPIHEFRPGAVLLARKSGNPMVLFAADCRFALRTRSWDQHLIPFPFSKLKVRVRIVDLTEGRWPSDKATAQALREKLLALSQA